MAAGISREGDRAVIVDESAYRSPAADVAVFYGLEGNLPRIFDDYRRSRKAVYVDLGYWERKPSHDRWAGYHKVCVNDRHPTAYFQRVQHGPQRAEALGIRPSPWQKGHHILLAGMGDKGAVAEGYAPEQWEHDTIAEIRRHTKRAIIYRPKPSWKGARPINGTIYAPPKEPLHRFMRGCHAVVTHHSNVAVDGLVAGIPAFVWRGVGVTIGSQDLGLIENPPLPEGREQWINDIAWTQWNVDEMRKGLAWRYLKDEGLV